MTTVNIARIPKPLLLRALWEKQIVAGFFANFPQLAPKYEDPQPGTNWDFDYHCGRAIKCDLKGDTVYTGSYNRDAGEGAFEAIVSKLRAEYP